MSNNQYNTAMQNSSCMQQGLASLYAQQNNDPLNGMTLNEMKQLVSRTQAIIDKQELHTPKQGPTNHELNTHESLRNSWEAYMITRNLIGLK